MKHEVKTTGVYHVELDEEKFNVIMKFLIEANDHDTCVALQGWLDA